MSPEIQSQLVRLCSDYELEYGERFDHFYCPFLCVDEDVELCLGHIVPDAFSASNKKTIVQRADIDNFYGSVFEADFELVVNNRGASLEQILTDPKLEQALRTKLMVNGTPVRYYPFRGKKASGHSRLQFEKSNGEVAEFVIAAPADNIVESENWSFVVEKSFEISAMASLLKAAFLTMFDLLGYSYALSAAGLFLGHDLLGKFFREHRHIRRATLYSASEQFFRPFQNLVRPVLGNAPFLGTTEDKTVTIFHTTFGNNFAIGVYVRTNSDLHIVLTPAFDNPDAIPVFLKFLESPPNEVLAKTARYVESSGHWDVAPTSLPMHWPRV